MTLIADAVKAYYQKAREPKFGPTELRLSETGDCARKRVLKALGFDPTHIMTDEAMKAMESGKLWEDWLVDRIAESGIACIRQVEVTTPYGAGGHIDILISTDNGELSSNGTIVEVKAINQWTPPGTLPKPEHVAQVQAYLHFYGRERGIDKALLVYIHRENGAGPFEYPITYDPEVGAEIESGLRSLRYTVDFGEGIATPEGMQMGKYPCSWTSKTGGGHCPMFGHCWPTAEAKGA